MVISGKSIIFTGGATLLNFLYNSKLAVVNWLYIIVNISNLKSVGVTPEISDEYEEVVDHIRSIGKGPYVKDWAMAKKHGLILYNTIRNKRPDCVLETGVANGFSTRIILEAMEKNGSGKLYSVDIKNDVGKFVKAGPSKIKKRWNLIINKKMRQLDSLIKRGGLDIFIHDSDHSYKNMIYEFDVAYKRVRSGGLIMSDDTNSNSAFLDFCRSKGLNFELYPSFRKTFGIAYV